MLEETRFFATDDQTARLFSEGAYTREQAEAYYRWWYEWSKHTVENDPELAELHPDLFEHFPVDNHQTPFRDRSVEFWAAQTDALGKFITDALLSKLDQYGQFALQTAHRKLLADLERMRPPTASESEDWLVAEGG